MGKEQKGTRSRGHTVKEKGTQPPRDGSNLLESGGLAGSLSTAGGREKGAASQLRERGQKQVRSCPQSLSRSVAHGTSEAEEHWG